MHMEHSEYIKLREQLESDFNSIYRRATDCDKIVEGEEKKISGLNDNFMKLTVEQTKTNTRLGIVIAILAAIAAPILVMCVERIFS